MLSIDMRDLSERQLIEIVAEHCSSSGIAPIFNVRVIAADEQNVYGAAAIKVSTAEDAETLARVFGGSRCGCNVIINLLQTGRAVPYASRKNLFYHARPQPKAMQSDPADDDEFEPPADSFPSPA